MTKVTHKSSKETLRRRINELSEEVQQMHGFINALPNSPGTWSLGQQLSPTTRLGIWFQRNGKDAR